MLDGRVFMFSFKVITRSVPGLLIIGGIFLRVAQDPMGAPLIGIGIFLYILMAVLRKF